ncbi:hypothetical protein [Ferrimonas balearica]|uniref:hypothetical protein n=1 Tax=Ferrimonas balearica TaxID=44012 RepID=UPI001C58A9E8|nr:hypothetical protein [Ferrimonas balearica]MBW3163690.1 hypothetical protein [Ferrimonas balearica]
MKLKYILLLLSASAYGYEPEQAQANLSTDYASCTSYFLIVSQGFEASGKSGEVYQSLAEQSFSLASGLSNPKVTEARVKLSYQEMASEIDHNFSNIAILIDKHAKLCTQLMEDPSERLDYWLNK